MEDHQLTSGMTGQEDKQGSRNMEHSRNMVFMAILEEYVYRFDWDEDERKYAFPSISFFNAKTIDSLLDVSIQKVSYYIPFCEHLQGQQVVTIEV